MRIFGQMSVGGFKLFDIDFFAHQHDKLRYATISDIVNVATTRTYIVACDMHGMRLETCRLFSRGEIDLLLQNDFLNNSHTTILYIDSCGLTRDSMSRDCKISLCFMSENAEDFKLLQQLAACIALTEDRRVKDLLHNLLSLQILNDIQVLAFDNEAMEALKAHVAENYSFLASNVFADCSQMIGLHDGVSIYTMLTNLKGLFNHESYLTADMSAFKSYGRSGQLPEPIFLNHMSHLAEPYKRRSDSKLHSFVSKVIDSLCGLNSDFNNKKND